MTSSIISFGRAGRDNPSPARPHPRRDAVWTPFESVAWAVALLLFVRRIGGSQGGHRRRATSGTRVTASFLSPRVRQFLKDWWVHLAVLIGFAFVTIVGLLVISAQVPR